MLASVRLMVKRVMIRFDCRRPDGYSERAHWSRSDGCSFACCFYWATGRRREESPDSKGRVLGNAQAEQSDTGATENKPPMAESISGASKFA
jgi:hypothetical protein